MGLDSRLKHHAQCKGVNRATPGRPAAASVTGATHGSTNTAGITMAAPRRASRLA
jgi:hypothetical protein